MGSEVSGGKRKPLNKREREIGERLKTARENLHKSQEEFAREIAIQRQRLASYEEGRAAVRYDLALRLCRQHIVGEKWLATGKGGWREFLDIGGEAVVSQVPADMPYGAAYDDYLSGVYESIAKQLAAAGQKIFRVELKAGENLNFVFNLFLFLFDDWVTTIKDGEKIREFLDQMMTFGGVQIQEYLTSGNLLDIVPINQGLARKSSKVTA